MNRQERRASKANGRKMMSRGWTPWEDLTDLARERSLIRWPDGRYACEKFLQNCLYSVQLHRKPSAWGEIILLMVRRNDEAPIRSWADMQRIKNEVVGEHRTAVEVYPATVDLVDQANMYHLWVLPENIQLPFGLHLKGKS